MNEIELMEAIERMFKARGCHVYLAIAKGKPPKLTIWRNRKPVTIHYFGTHFLLYANGRHKGTKCETIIEVEDATEAQLYEAFNVLSEEGQIIIPLAPKPWQLPG